MSDADLTVVLGRLRDSLAAMRTSVVHSQIVAPKAEVFDRFGPIFAIEHIPKLTPDEFRPFLYFEHNHHWTGLHRQVNRLCADTSELRNALLVLLDETRPIDDRLDEVARIAPTGLGKGIMTAILHVAHPDKYGVWNNTSEGALAMLGIFPEFPRGASFGEKYVLINALLNRIAAALEMDLWTLDALWWFIQQGDTMPRSVVGSSRDVVVNEEALPQLAASDPATSPATQMFGLERHLHEFLRDNWERLELGRDWRLYAEPGDDEAGYEYACPVGRIDLLAKHRREKKWLVVELKRKDTTDTTVGQALRYMGWVQMHLAEPDDEVEGLIIAREGDAGLQYAISRVGGLRFQVYHVEFRLTDPPALNGNR